MDIVQVEMLKETEEAGVEETELDDRVEFCGQEDQSEVVVACN